MEEERTRIRALRDRLEHGILQQIGHCVVLGDDQSRLPNTSNIAFEHLEGEAIIHHLNRAGIAASLGSACASGSIEPSHVLRRHEGADARHCAAPIRFSLSRENTDDEIDRVLTALPEIIAKVRELSPAWREQQAEPSHAELRVSAGGLPCRSQSAPP